MMTLAYMFSNRCSTHNIDNRDHTLFARPNPLPPRSNKVIYKYNWLWKTVGFIARDPAAKKCTHRVFAQNQIFILFMINRMYIYQGAYQNVAANILN